MSRHNPYFNRWFSAIKERKRIRQSYTVTILILIDGFLQFNCSSALLCPSACHNPYFNRWFSAIGDTAKYNYITKKVTILILIDGFLQ